MQLFCEANRGHTAEVVASLPIEVFPPESRPRCFKCQGLMLTNPEWLTRWEQLNKMTLDEATATMMAVSPQDTSRFNAKEKNAIIVIGGAWKLGLILEEEARARFGDFADRV
jgi:hypothetical protein